MADDDGCASAAKKASGKRGKLSPEERLERERARKRRYKEREKAKRLGLSGPALLIHQDLFLDDLRKRRGPAHVRLSDAERKVRDKESAHRYYLRKKAEPGWLKAKVAETKRRQAMDPEGRARRTAKWNKQNPEKRREIDRRNRQSHKAERAAYRRERRRKNPEQFRRAEREWASTHPEKIKEYSRARQPKQTEYQRLRRRRDPEYRLRCYLGVRLARLAKKCGASKSASIVELIGCSLTQLRTHLESQFLPGMSWENHGVWHVDHRIPISAFDLRDPAEQKRACHFSNLQPLWARENLRKKDRLDWKPESLQCLELRRGASEVLRAAPSTATPGISQIAPNGRLTL